MAREGGKDRGMFEKVPGVWWVRYVDSQGKERREKAGTKSQARLLYQKRQAEKLQGRKLPETMRRKRSVTIGEAIERYRPLFEAKASAKDDIRFARLWAEAFGCVGLDELKPRDVEKWRDERLNTAPDLGGSDRRPDSRSVVKKRRSPATVNRAVAFLKRIYNLSIRDGLHEGRNPAAQVGMMTENNTRVRWLTEAEEERLRESMDPKAWILVEVALVTGMRRGEQFNLRREDVELRTGTLTIPKSKHGEKRHVHLGPRGKALFREILASHTSAWVFPSATGRTALDGNNFCNRVFVPALKKARIRDFHWHDLRHTYGSRLAMEGVELQVIRDLMGHGSITMTERYAHLAPGKLKLAVKGL